MALVVPGFLDDVVSVGSALGQCGSWSECHRVSGEYGWAWGVVCCMGCMVGSIVSGFAW